MITEFGKALRKIRIDHQEILKDMAEKLQVSSAYLSAVETGKRRIPSGWAERISEIYTLNTNAMELLKKAEDDSRQDVTISLEGASSQRKDAVLSFARALDGLSDEELTKIMSAMKKKSNGRGDKKNV